MVMPNLGRLAHEMTRAVIPQMQSQICVDFISAQINSVA